MNPKFYKKKNCPNCGKEFWTRIKVDQKFCCNACRVEYVKKHPEIDKERVEKIKKTKLEKYGDENYINVEKAKKTNLEKYGVENVFKSEDVKQKIRKTHGGKWITQTDDFKNKSKETKLEKYGNEDFNNREKYIKTCEEKYGVNNVFQLDSIKDKSRQTNNEKYNVDYPSQSPEIQQKIKETRNEIFYSKLLNGDRLGLNVVPLFDITEYNGKEHTNRYKFLCKDCNKEFEDNIDNGRIPICPHCNPKIQYVSSYEVELSNFLQDNNITHETNNRTILHGKELDIYIPEKKIAIEFNGNFWHTELYGNKDKNYHYNKMVECNKQDIQLIQIFEDEWLLKKDIVLNKLKSMLGINKDVIYARKCVVKEVSSKEKNIFLEETHIQGKDNSKIKIGLYHQNELVCIMTFGDKRKCLGQSRSQFEYELIRFSSNIRVVGGFSKLIKYFVNQYSPQKIISYADRRWSVGNVYIKNGFKLISETPQNFWYVHKSNFLKRTHRYTFCKHMLENKLEHYDENLTGWENMQLNGYDRIWDCGNLKYELNL